MKNPLYAELTRGWGPTAYRGSSWIDDGKFPAISHPSGRHASFRFAYFGFRLYRTREKA